MSKRLRVGVIFGGRSGEHEVSLRSAESVINALDPEKYEVVSIAITKQGKWIASSEAASLLPSTVIKSADQHVAIFGDPKIPIRIAFFKGPDGEICELFQNEVL